LTTQFGRSGFRRDGVAARVKSVESKGSTTKLVWPRGGFSLDGGTLVEAQDRAASCMLSMPFSALLHTEKGGATCHVDKNLNLLAAATTPSDRTGVYATPLPEAEKILREEFLAWARIADEIIGGNSQASAAARP